MDNLDNFKTGGYCPGCLKISNDCTCAADFLKISLEIHEKNKKLMKLFKINNDFFVVAEKTEIKVGDFCIDQDTRDVFKVAEKAHAGLIRSETDSYIEEACLRVSFSTTPFDNVSPLILSEVRRLINKDNSERRAHQYGIEHCRRLTSKERAVAVIGFEQGYKQAVKNREDKEFSLDQLKEVFSMGRENKTIKDFNNYIDAQFDTRDCWDIELDNNGCFKLIQ